MFLQIKHSYIYRIPFYDWFTRKEEKNYQHKKIHIARNTLKMGQGLIGLQLETCQALISTSFENIED